MGLDESNGGTLYIYMKYGGFVGQKRVKKILAKEGFKKPIAYYDPNYDNYKSSTYLKFGAVHWEGNVLSETSGKVQLKLPHFGLENVILMIEGMASDGTLFSEIKTIHLN